MKQTDGKDRNNSDHPLKPNENTRTITKSEKILAIIKTSSRELKYSMKMVL